MAVDKIPDEIMREAWEIATAWCAHVLVDGAYEVIARAMMARDKRAAEIARECFDDPQAEADRDYIAAAILSYNGGRDAD